MLCNRISTRTCHVTPYITARQKKKKKITAFCAFYIKRLQHSNNSNNTRDKIIKICKIHNKLSQDSIFNEISKAFQHAHISFHINIVKTTIYVG